MHPRCNIDKNVGPILGRSRPRPRPIQTTTSSVLKLVIVWFPSFLQAVGAQSIRFGTRANRYQECFNSSQVESKCEHCSWSSCFYSRSPRLSMWPLVKPPTHVNMSCHIMNKWSSSCGLGMPWRPLDHAPLRNPLVPDVRITGWRSTGFLEPCPHRCPVHLGGLAPSHQISHQSSLSLSASLKVAGKIVWHNRVETPLGACRRWMKTCGFEEDSPWSWRMSGVRVSLCANININLQKFNLGNGWKIFCWNKNSGLRTPWSCWSPKHLCESFFGLRLEAHSTCHAKNFGSFGCPWCHGIPGLVSWPGCRWQ